MPPKRRTAVGGRCALRATQYHAGRRLALPSEARVGRVCLASQLSRPGPPCREGEPGAPGLRAQSSGQGSRRRLHRRSRRSIITVTLLAFLSTWPLT